MISVDDLDGMKYATLILCMMIGLKMDAQEIYYPSNLEPAVFVETEDSNEFTIVEGEGFTVRVRYVDSRYRTFLIPLNAEVKGRGWEITNALYGDVVSIVRKDVTGNGVDELVLYWQSMNGHSGSQGGQSSSEEGLLIIDLEKERILFDDYFYMSTEVWWNEVDWGEDGDQEPEIIDSGEEYNCESFLLEFNAGTIYFNPDTAGCEGMEQGYFVKWMDEYDAFQIHYPWE